MICFVLSIVSGENTPFRPPDPLNRGPSGGARGGVRTAGLRSVGKTASD